MKRSLAGAIAIAAVLSFAACGGGGGGGTSGGETVPAATPTPTPAATNPPSLPNTATVGASSAYVSSSNGHTLYTFGADAAGVSNCTSASGCTGIWPPYTAPAGTTAPSGTGFGLITRSDGSLQWTYQNYPLYMYSGDSSAGQSNGQGINSYGGVWGVSRPAAAGTVAGALEPTAPGGDQRVRFRRYQCACADRRTTD